MNREQYIEFFSCMDKNKRCEIAIEDLWVAGKRWGPVSWNVIYVEVWANTKVGDAVLKKLK